MEYYGIYDKMCLVIEKFLTKLIEIEQGQLLPIVLVMLLAGVPSIVPTLAVVSISIKSGKHFKDDPLQLYAADAGIEAAVALLREIYPEPSWAEDEEPIYLSNSTVDYNTVTFTISKTAKPTYPPTYEAVI